MKIKYEKEVINCGGCGLFTRDSNGIRYCSVDGYEKNPIQPAYPCIHRPCPIEVKE